MNIQDEQQAEARFILDSGESALEAAEKNGFSWTGMDGDRVITCGGLIRIWAGRFVSWCLLSSDIGPAGMLWMIRAFRDKMDESGATRIEASVREGFDRGHRMMRMLGFRPEGLMLHYDPYGNNYVLYARIKT
jgi:hypothetical protein